MSSRAQLSGRPVLSLECVGSSARHASRRLAIARSKLWTRGRWGQQTPTVRAAHLGVTEQSQLGLVDEMRKVAMNLHTKDQAKEGGQKTAPKPFKSWKYSREGFLKFLVESSIVYEALESSIQNTVDSNGKSIYGCLMDTGLERLENLRKNIEWMEFTYGMSAPKPQPNGCGAAYASYLRKLAAEDPPTFVNHYYNVYYAHASGGRMIGKQVANEVLDGRFSDLAFYAYDRQLKPMLDETKSMLNEFGKSFSREEKDRCLQETSTAFKYSGTLLQCLFDRSD